MLNSPLENSAKSTVRGAAAAALGRLGDPRAGEALLSAASDPSPEVRYAAIRSLGFVKHDAAARDLIKALDDDELHVRRAAVISLGLIGASEAIPRLHEMLRSPDPWTRLYAAEALASLGDPSLSELLPSLIQRETRFAPSRRKRWRKLRRMAFAPRHPLGSQ
jgi:HEAT repeat protein